MGGGNKKNKRGSIPSSSSGSGSGSASAFAKIELIERTAENDYGVMSDPEETDPSSPMPLLTKEESAEEAKAAAAPTAPANSDEAPTAEPLQHSVAAQPHNDDVRSCNSSESPNPPHGSQHSSPSLQPSLQAQDQLSQPQISQTQAPSKSLDALKLKLNKDKNFSKKITLHTVFSYIILAIEIQRASSASIARISPREVEDLVTFMIENHSASEDIQTYLRTLIETKVIYSMIEAIIEFNKDQTDALDKLFIAEEIELQEMNTRETKTEDVPVTIVSSDTTITADTPQTPQRCGFFKRMRCFFSGCCG